MRTRSPTLKRAGAGACRPNEPRVRAWGTSATPSLRLTAFPGRNACPAAISSAPASPRSMTMFSSAQRPFSVIGARKIDLRRQLLDAGAPFVDGPGADHAHGAVEREAAAFPRVVKDRLVLFRLDFAEAVHAAHVVNAVHYAASAGFFGRPVPIMQSRVTKVGELLLAPALGARRPHRQHDEAGLGGRVPHPDLRVGRQRHAEIGEHAARIVHRARAVRRRLVPDRRQAEHFPRIAGAQRADDDVVESPACSRPRSGDRRHG